MPRYFTLQQARDTLSEIHPIVDDIMEIRQEIVDRHPEVWPVIERSVGNGGSKVASKLVIEFESLEKLIRQVLATGTLFKDINIGLLDFPALRNGSEVYLCWKWGEDDIEFWHEIDAGYAGRQPIDTF